MFDFYEKRKLRRFLYSKIVSVFPIVIALALAYSVVGVYKKQRETRLIKEERARELALLSEREQALEEELERLSTERGIEEEIRSKFEVGREGEVAVILVNPQTENESLATPPKGNIWIRFLEWFKRD